MIVYGQVKHLFVCNDELLARHLERSVDADGLSGCSSSTCSVRKFP